MLRTSATSGLQLSAFTCGMTFTASCQAHFQQNMVQWIPCKGSRVYSSGMSICIDQTRRQDPESPPSDCWTWSCQSVACAPSQEKGAPPAYPPSCRPGLTCTHFQQSTLTKVVPCVLHLGLPWFLNGCTARRSALLGAISCMRLGILRQRNHDQTCNNAIGQITKCNVHQCATPAKHRAL